MRDPIPPPTMASLPPSPAEPPFRRGAPNVVVVVFDDLGFGHLESYGSDLATPNVDALASGTSSRRSGRMPNVDPHLGDGPLSPASSSHTPTRVDELMDVNMVSRDERTDDGRRCAERVARRLAG